jgi:hypothetical protein
MIAVGGWPPGRRNVRIFWGVGLLLASGDGVVGLRGASYGTVIAA